MLQSLEHLEQYSTIALYSAMAVYAIAFVFFVVELANRSGAGGGALPETDATGRVVVRSRSLRIGFACRCRHR